MSDLARSESVEPFRRMVREYLDGTKDGRAKSLQYRCYRDGDQWTLREKHILNSRDQPPIVFNRIGRKIDSVRGLEQTRRTDPKATARTPQHAEQADLVTEALRFEADRIRLNAQFSEVMDCGLVEGTGAAEVIVEPDRRDGVSINVRAILWREFVHDPRSMRADFSDARYKGILKWMDADDVIALWPEYADAVSASLELATEKAVVPDIEVSDQPDGVNWIDAKRRRVQVLQLYYKSGDGWNYAVVAGDVLIESGPSYYLDEDGQSVCPIHAWSAYVAGDGERYGVVRDMMGPQDEINHRRSKAVHLAHSTKVISVRGAVLDVGQAKQELARPNGWVEVVDKDMIDILPVGDETAINLQMLQEAKTEIDALGANNALQGKNTETQSGRAIIAQQQAGMAELAPIFDRFNDFKLSVYRALWQRIRQTWTGPKWIRVTDDENSLQFIGVNEPTFDENGFPTIKNRIAEIDVDIILDAGPDTISLQAEEFEKLAEIMPGLISAPPPYALALIEASSLPEKRKKKMRELIEGKAEQQPDPMIERMKALDLAEREAEIEHKRAQSQALLIKAQTEAQTAPISLQIEQAKLADAQHARQTDMKVRADGAAREGASIEALKSEQQRIIEQLSALAGAVNELVQAMKPAAAGDMGAAVPNGRYLDAADSGDA